MRGGERALAETERYRHELETGKPIRWQRLLDGLADDLHRSRGELFRQFGRWFTGPVSHTALRLARARTSEGQERAGRGKETVKTLQAFVFEQATGPGERPDRAVGRPSGGAEQRRLVKASHSKSLPPSQALLEGGGNGTPTLAERRGGRCCGKGNCERPRRRDRTKRRTNHLEGVNHPMADMQQ